MPPESSPELAPVREGDVLDGKYRVDRVLGVGGMGVVVAATHAGLNQRVAIKFLLPAAMANPQIVERFAREARAAAQIQSEHVARVIDVGTLPTGSPYMVMEFLEGSDLAEALLKSGPVPVATAVLHLLQACEAIAEAHALGIVHRDLKPANLFLARRAGRDPIVKVLDFGISKSGEAGSGGLTKTSAIMGSPYYMAPEQMMSSKDVDARSDIWALGIVLYELLTGAPPFVADSMPEIVFQVTQRDATPLRERRPDVPQGLSDVVARCMARDPAKRYPNVAKLASALAPFGPPRSEVSVERIARVLGASMPPVGVAAAPAAPLRQTGSTWASSHALSRTTARSPRILVAAAAAACLVVAGVVAVVASQSGHKTADERPTSTSAAAPPRATSAAPAPEAPTGLAPPPETAALPTASSPPAPIPPAAPTPAAAQAPASAARPPPAMAARPRPAAVAAPPAAGPAAPPPAPAGHGLNMGMKE